MGKNYVIGGLALFFLVTSVFAQSGRTAGKIRGRVTSEATGEPLVGANVILVGTSFGNATNVNGEYIIPNVPAGEYDVKVTYIGYSPKIIKGVTVFPGQTNIVDLGMQIQAVEGQAVEVVAEARKTIIQVRAPATQKEITSEDIEHMPVTDFTDIVANSSGAIETMAGRSRGIHMRGGRSGEVAFYVDGVMTNDPVDHSVGVEIDNNAIEQIVISNSGFSAEYGNAMSGAVSIITKSGKKTRHSGMLEYETDSWISRLDESLDFGYDKYRLNVNGPIPFTKGTATYYLFGTFEDTDIASPRPISQSHNGVKTPNANGKLIYSPEGSAFKATLSAGFNHRDQMLYNHNISYGNWLRSYYRRQSGHNRVSMKLQSTISNNTAWSFLVSYYNTFNAFSSGEGQNYKEFKYISSRLDWMNSNDGAVSMDWYDPKTREWTEIVNEQGIPLIKENYKAPNGSPLGERSYADQAFYYYYAQKGYYDIEDGAWVAPRYEVEALNQRYHDAHYWYIPSDLEEESQFYDPDDHTVHKREFDRHDYADYLFMSPDSQAVHDLWGYYGDLHNGWYWDRDLFNVFTYGPGRPRFHDQNTRLYTAEFHLNSQLNMHNEVKLGWKIERADLSYFDIQFANQNPYFDSYDYQPFSGAAWLEDKYEYEDLIATLGLRYDYFHPQAKAFSNPDDFDAGQDGVPDEQEPGYDPIENPDPNNDNYDEDTNPSGTEGDGSVDYIKATPKHKLSPRFGISFAVSDKTAMYANYGHFFQIPEYGEIYQNLYADLTSGLPLVGNPNVKPERTVAYEAGIKHRFSEDLGLEISAYYKDAENLLATRTYNTIFNGQVATVTFQETQDFAKIKGVDLKFTLRNFYGFHGEVSYSYLNAKGTGSSNREFYYLYIYEVDRPLPAKEYPLEFDITHSFKGNLNYFIPPRSGPSIFGMRPLQNFNANLFFIFNSGSPYTPTDQYDKPQELGSKRMPATTRFDLRLEKYIPLTNNIRMSVYADIRNLFDRQNIAWVYPYSGKPNDNGKKVPYNESVLRSALGKIDPTTGKRIDTLDEAYAAQLRLKREHQNEPYNYGRPRIVRLGISLTF